jgi:hypothetical protein
LPVCDAKQATFFLSFVHHHAIHKNAHMNQQSETTVEQLVLLRPANVNRTLDAESQKMAVEE